MRIEDFKQASLDRAALRITLHCNIAKVALMIDLTRLESSKHDVACDGVLVLSGSGAALIKSFAHHEDGIGVVTKFELYFRQLHHGNAHWVLELLLCQVLNLELFLIDCTFVLKSSLFLP